MAGRYADYLWQVGTYSMFQSSPGLMAGRYRANARPLLPFGTRFNPRPA